MPIYSYQKKSLSLAQILSSTGLTPTSEGRSDPPLQFFEFPAPLSADEQAALDQFQDDLGYEPKPTPGITAPSPYSFSGSFLGALGLVTAYFPNVGLALASIAPLRFPVLSQSLRARIGLYVSANALLSATTFELSVSGAAPTGAPAPVVVVPALTFGYFTASGDVSFADGDQVDLVATSVGGGAGNGLAVSGTVQLYC